jgi:hypothetical protein
VAEGGGRAFFDPNQELIGASWLQADGNGGLKNGQFKRWLNPRRCCSCGFLDRTK